MAGGKGGGSEQAGPTLVRRANPTYSSQPDPAPTLPETTSAPKGRRVMVNDDSGSPSTPSILIRANPHRANRPVHHPIHRRNGSRGRRQDRQSLASRNPAKLRRPAAGPKPPNPLRRSVSADKNCQAVSLPEFDHQNSREDGCPPAAPVHVNRSPPRRTAATKANTGSSAKISASAQAS